MPENIATSWRKLPGYQGIGSSSSILNIVFARLDFGAHRTSRRWFSIAEAAEQHIKARDGYFEMLPRTVACG